MPISRPSLIAISGVLFLNLNALADPPPSQFHIEELAPFSIKCAHRTAPTSFGSDCPTLNFTRNVNIVDNNGSLGKGARYVGGVENRDRRYQIVWRIPALPGKAYQVSAWVRLLRRNCYVEPDLAKTWMGGRAEATQGTFCGSAKVFVKNQQGIGLASTRAIYDFPYMSNYQGNWRRQFLTIRTGANETFVEALLDIAGGDFTLELDNLNMTPLEGETAEAIAQQSGSWQDANYHRFTSLSMSAMPFRVETRGSWFEWSSSATGDFLRVRRLGGTGQDLLTLKLPSGELAQASARTLKRIDGNPERASEVIVSGASAHWILAVDGTILLNVLRPLAVEAIGAQSPRPGYSWLEAGVFFQASTDPSNEGGFLFSPIYDRTLTTGLSSTWPFGQAILTQHPIERTFLYNSDLFLQKAARPDFFKIMATFNNAQGQSVPDRVKYQFLEGDRALLSAFPERGFRKAHENPAFPIAALGNCDPLSPLQSEIAQCENELKKLQGLGAGTVFTNGMKWSRSVQFPLKTYFEFRRGIDAANKKWVNENRYLGALEVPDPNALSSCPASYPLPPSCTVDLTAMNSSQMDAQLALCLQERPVLRCANLVDPAYDSMGPWLVTQTPVRLETFKRFLRRTQELGMKRILYVSPQYTDGDAAELLKQLGRLWNVDLRENGAPLIEGFYFDGFPEGRALDSLRIAREARKLVGEGGILVFHLSTDSTLLPDSYRYRPVYLEKYATFIANGEGNKHAWDLELQGSLRDTPLASPPPIWCTMHSGRGLGGTGYLIFPELRPIDNRLRNEDKELAVAVSLPPARQIEAQALCGGAVFAPVQGSLNNGQWVESGFSWGDKFKKNWSEFFGPNRPAGECGYLSRMLRGVPKGYCP